VHHRRSGKRRKKLGHRCGAPDVGVGDVVAAEHDEIRLCFEQQCHGPVDVGVGHGGAGVHVGDEAYAQAVERGRQPDDAQLRLHHVNLVPLVRDAVADAPHERSGPCCYQPLQRSSPRETPRGDAHGSGAAMLAQPRRGTRMQAV
jgi:hypothetical protein